MMRATVVSPFVDPLRHIYLAQGIEIEVPEDRRAELARWLRYHDEQAQAEAAKETTKKTKAKKAKQ